MFSYIWPIALLVFSNIFYQISAKSTPAAIHPLASLTVTYFIGAIVSGILYFALNRGGSLLAEYSHLNWTSFVLGIAVVGLETGWIYAYKAGWQVSMGYIVVTSIVSTALLFVGYLLYKEKITRNKVIGLALCLVGLVIINL